MTWTPRTVRAVLIVIAALAIIVAYWWWQGRARPVVTIPAASSSASAIALPSNPPQVIVHVIGRVRRPGIVTLDDGSRVADAIEAAGGLRDGASSGDLNLARVLVDGEQVVVGGHHPAEPVTTDGTPATAGPLDLNTATATQLEDLPGVGPVLAERIIAWRDANGRFTAVDVLGEVAGIGDVLMEQLRPLVRV